jgi:hypothetical protein
LFIFILVRQTPYSQTLAASFQNSAMRLIYILAFILGHLTVFGQVDSLGLDNNPNLSKAEGNHLNDQFKKQRGQFTFNNKSIVFITGSSGTKVMTKQEYFSDVKKWAQNNSQIVTSLLILTKEEKFDSGYDAIVTAWVKVLTDKNRKKIIRKLKASR